MFFISKEDKKLWSEYISNINSYSVNFNLNKKIVGKKYSSNSNFKETKSFPKLIKKGLLRVDSVIHLHGYRLNEARIAFKKFIVISYNLKHKNLLVITGKGLTSKKNNEAHFSQEKGVLNKSLPIWLKQEPFKNIVNGFRYANQRHGGRGAYYILLKSKL